MKSRFGIILFAVSVLVFSAAAQASPTGTQAFVPAQGGWVTQRGADVLLIETGLTVSGSIGRALNELAVAYDFFVGSDFSGVNLAPYLQVFVGMDGGTITTASIQNVAEWARLGGCAHFYGGSCWQEYANALNTYFLQNQTGNYCWSQVAGFPDATVTNAGHYLAAGLPPTYNFIDSAASFYQTRSTDGAASVAARNGDSFDMLLSKPAQAGNFDICINSPYDGYYSNNTDYQWLKQVVANMLTCGRATPVRPATWGMIKTLY